MAKAANSRERDDFGVGGRLILRGAAVWRIAKLEEGDTVLHKAAMVSRDPRVFAAVADAARDLELNWPEGAEYTPLHHAVPNGQSRTAKILLTGNRFNRLWNTEDQHRARQISSARHTQHMTRLNDQ